MGWYFGQRRDIGKIPLSAGFGGFGRRQGNDFGWKDVYKRQVNMVFELLGQSPTSFKGGAPWGIITGIEPIFVAVGSSLVVLFFVIGFCSESIDVREEMRFEVILLSLIHI